MRLSALWQGISRSAWKWGMLCALASAPAVAGTIGTTVAAPITATVGVPSTITVTASISDASVITNSVQLQSLDSTGKVVAIVGTLHDDGINGDAIAADGVYTLLTTVYQNSPTTLTFRVTAGFLGSLVRAFSSPITVTVSGANAGVAILSPTNLLYTNTSPVTVSGTIGDPGGTVKINGINAPVTGGQFLATVPLVEGVNTLTAVAVNTGGVVSTSTVQATLDTTPPHLTIDSPLTGTTTSASSVTVTGTANDIVVGTVNSGDVQVVVNGVAAQVANRTYLAANVPLAVGANTITATGRDRAGNGTTVTSIVTRIAQGQSTMPTVGMPVITNTLNLVSGNNQTGTIGTALPAPLIVSLTDSTNKPVPNATIVFAVTGNNGNLTGGGTTASAVMVNTDQNGTAQVQWSLGLRSGAGIDTVQASTVLATSAVSFTATSLTSGAVQIVVDSGNGQTGALGQALVFPFVAVVTDAGHNRVPNVPVTFTVKQGGGTMAGLLSQIVKSDSNGRALALLTLGTQPGNANNVVEANFSGNPGMAVAFSASAKAPSDPANTMISGLVIDNSNNPVQGATMRLYQTNQAQNNNLPVQIGTPVQTDANGMFLISPAPVGYFKLMADGTTAIGGKSYPTLEFDIVTIAGQNNTLGMSISLPALDTVNQLCVDATHGGTLTLPQSPGFSLTVLPGSATFPGGSKTGCVSVTPVNGDKIPMAPGFGQQPRYIVTIQPVGTTFNPPAPITIPNVDGLLPNAITEMYSYDHDLSMFVAIGTGKVSSDGSVIASNPGVGVLKAGWHCGGDPNTSGNAGTCPTCQKCSGSSCVTDPAQDGKPLPNNKCMQCKNGSAQDIPLNFKDDSSVTGQVALPDSVKTWVNSLIQAVPGLSGVSLTEAKGEVNGKIADCCDPNKSDFVKDGVKDFNAGITLAAKLGKIKIWPPGTPDLSYKQAETDFFGNIYQVEVVFEVGVYLQTDLQFSGKGGHRSNACKMEDCLYGGIEVGLQTALFPEINALGCFDSTLTSRYCAQFTIKPVQLSIAVTGSAGYNLQNCMQGLVACGSIGKIELSMEVTVGPFTLAPKYTITEGLVKGCTN